MTTLTILRGISGSGKSTWAREQNAVVVSRDAIRLALYGVNDQAYYAVSKDVLLDRERVVTASQDGTVAALLRAGKDVIVDNTNIRWEFVKNLAAIGYAAGAEVKVKVFDVSLRVAIDNNYRRAAAGGREVEESVIRDQYNRFKSNRYMTLDEPSQFTSYTGTPGKPKAFLVDIDGTLAHNNGKRGFYDWAKVGSDDVDEVIAEVVGTLTHGSAALSLNDPFIPPMESYTTIVMSGRDEACRAETEQWLNDKAITYDHLFMRPAGDMRKDSIVKHELFNTYVRDNFDVKFVLDDRQQVVDMWRAMGITCLQVAEGNF